MVVFQNPLDEFKLRSADGFEHELTITGIVEEWPRLSTRYQFSEGLEISVEHVPQNVVRSQTFWVQIFFDRIRFSNACKHLRGIIIKGARFNVVLRSRTIGGQLILAAYVIILVRDIKQGQVQGGVDSFLDAHHDVANEVETLMSGMDQFSRL